MPWPAEKVQTPWQRPRCQLLHQRSQLWLVRRRPGQRFQTTLRRISFLTFTSGEFRCQNEQPSTPKTLRSGRISTTKSQRKCQREFYMAQSVLARIRTGAAKEAAAGCWQKVTKSLMADRKRPWNHRHLPRRAASLYSFSTRQILMPHISRCRQTVYLAVCAGNSNPGARRIDQGQQKNFQDPVPANAAG